MEALKLMDEIESNNFECTGGPLKNLVQWNALRALIASQSAQPTPSQNYDAFRDWLFRVLDHAADYEESINLTEAKSRIDLHLTEKLRALIDQPAEQPAQSQELTDAQIIKAAYQARIIDANHDWVGRLEANTMIHLRHFVDMLALQSKPAKG